jgi:hypothetical protein
VVADCADEVGGTARYHHDKRGEHSQAARPRARVAPTALADDVIVHCRAPYLTIER